ncbi:hypothetical protein AX289_31285 [Methylorubrum populi]|nr:hypothetical protein AX289_31285 [Methylorubrum populi]
MKAPGYTVEEVAAGQFAVKVGNDVAGYVSEDSEHPGIWVNEDQSGRLMGRSATREQGAEFLAAWFVAVDEDRT